MSDAADWNTQIINEFRENGGKVGGQFEGAPMVLVHHRGRKSGKQNLTPMMYLPDERDADVIYVFASNAGAPVHPAWYYNLTTAGRTSIEVGAATYDVSVTEITGADRDRIYADQARRYPGFADYEAKVAGARVIPVLALRRV